MRISDTAMVYAAGLGTRMGVLTGSIPKPLLQIEGRTLIDIALDVVADAGFRRAVVNVHYRGNMIRSHLSSRIAPEIVISDESASLLETGGGLKKALPVIAGAAVFALNSDAFWKGANPARPLIDAWDPDRMDALLLLMPIARMPNNNRRGDFQFDRTGPLRWPTDGEITSHMYTGAQIIKTAPFERRPEQAFSTKMIWNEMIAADRCFGIAYPGVWVDVGRPESIAEATSVAKQ